MTEKPADNYAIYYADKLWNLLPAIYRALDTDQFDANGPLREMVNRIGATAGALRRDIDRLWENQSIEACDDWAIPYIAQLLDTRLVLGLDSRGQRLDVANTISYRRRKGTLGVLEQIAHDITGWDARVVEFFRRLGRTRHGLDPPVGQTGGPDSDAATLLQAEALDGPLTGTPIGGFADLRNVRGARQSRTAFDEFFHTADTRKGQGLFGWHAIPHLGVFVWRLLSLGVPSVTPVRGCDGWYTFDPTGRDVPLFAAGRGARAFGDIWVSPSEGQLPMPISQPLLDDDLALKDQGLGLYPVEPPATTMPPPVMAVAPADATDQPLPAKDLILRPAQGRFHDAASPPRSLLASYHYGFPSEIGAGPYDRRGQEIAVPTPDPPRPIPDGGPLPDPWPSSGTVTLKGSLTYTHPALLHVSGALTLKAENNQRPLIRMGLVRELILPEPIGPGPRPPRPLPRVTRETWTIDGDPGAMLTLDGLFVSGGDIVLTGHFASVTLTCCTLDPGSAATPGVFAHPGGSPPAALYQTAADGPDLVPTRLWIEAEITKLRVDRCVLGPIRTRIGSTRNGGDVATISISNSTLQAIRTAGLGPLRADEVKNPARLERLLQLGFDPVAALARRLNHQIEGTLGPLASPPLATSSPPAADLTPLLAELNHLIDGPSLYRSAVFRNVPLSAETSHLMRATPHGHPAPALNRLLLEDAWPLELADAALAFADGTVTLSRCTVMGRIVAHRFSASECILRELTQVDDTQDGCLRFTAYASGSKVPRQYECVTIPQSAPLFTSTDFGQPGYAQLLPTADLQRLPRSSMAATVSGLPSFQQLERMSRARESTTPFNTISAGAADGSEMGAYARDRNPIRAHALVLKLQEYMPANLVPVIVNVT